MGNHRIDTRVSAVASLTDRQQLPGVHAQYSGRMLVVVRALGAHSRSVSLASCGDPKVRSVDGRHCA
jgi:hypothetical protein